MTGKSPLSILDATLFLQNSLKEVLFIGHLSCRHKHLN